MSKILQVKHGECPYCLHTSGGDTVQFCKSHEKEIEADEAKSKEAQALKETP